MQSPSKTKFRKIKGALVFENPNGLTLEIGVLKDRFLKTTKLTGTRIYISEYVTKLWGYKTISHS